MFIYSVLKLLLYVTNTVVRVPEGNNVKISCILPGLIGYCTHCIIIYGLYFANIVVVNTAKEVEVRATLSKEASGYRGKSS